MTSSSRHSVHRPRPTENGGCAAGGTGTPFPPRSVSQESPTFVSLTIPFSIQEKLGASPDVLLCGFDGSDVASILRLPPPKLLVRDDDLNALPFRDPCHQTARSSNSNTS